MSGISQRGVDPEDAHPDDDDMCGSYQHTGDAHSFGPAWERQFEFPGDGAADVWGKRAKSNVSAIFIHAGAGYHSIANEQIHLTACSEAARAGMKCLKEGGSAVEAVEQAIKALEDKEITNAGYGSNLCIDGTVECDATIVDHLGRSGACGAVPNIKNPISLAKTILWRSNEPLSLRRVPPNLLIGDGARNFAIDCGMMLVSNKELISKNSRDRFLRWQEDLKRAEGPLPIVTGSPDRNASSIVDDEMNFPAELQRDHTNAILTGTWNEGQPDSPAQDPFRGNRMSTFTPWHQLFNPATPNNASVAFPSSPRNPIDRDDLNLLSSTFSPPKVASRSSASPIAKRIRVKNDLNGSPIARTAGSTDGFVSPPDYGIKQEDTEPSSPTRCFKGVEPSAEQVLILTDREDEDIITDTVGAIAIDRDGRIAAGSSSGGIGMKHRGRIGPAALVGIGTAVMPKIRDDPEEATVAAVTSGTGEHLATTIAAQKCASRLYHGTVRGAGGADVEEQDESAILQSFVVHDFQEHPGVKNSTSAGAIGVMAVKKTPNGYYLYFAHNTDSFALASMGSKDREPHCVMSRINEGSPIGIAQGARKIWIN